MMRNRGKPRLRRQALKVDIVKQGPVQLDPRRPPLFVVLKSVPVLGVSRIAGAPRVN
jgi:hypothetical protein